MTFGKEMKTFAVAITLVAFLYLSMTLARHLYRILQIKRKIRRQLADIEISKIKLKSESWFQGYESISASFLASLSIFNYSAEVVNSNGDELRLKIEADFHPISGALREAKINKAEQGGDGDAEEAV